MRLIAPFAALALTLAVGCNSSGFSGGSDKAPSKSKEEPEQDAKPNKKTKPLVNTDTDTSTDVSANDVPPKVQDDAPANAVTDGSFKAWAMPAAPAEGQDYQIFIQVQLPPNFNAANYTKEDLSGLLRGSDFYEQAIEKSFAPIPGPLPIIPPFQPRGKFEVKGRTALLSFYVLGAASHVSDTITIHSKALNEDATVTIVFQ